MGPLILIGLVALGLSGVLDVVVGFVNMGQAAVLAAQVRKIERRDR